MSKSKQGKSGKTPARTVNSSFTAPYRVPSRNPFLASDLPSEDERDMVISIKTHYA